MRLHLICLLMRCVIYYNCSFMLSHENFKYVLKKCIISSHVISFRKSVGVILHWSQNDQYPYTSYVSKLEPLTKIQFGYMTFQIKGNRWLIPLNKYNAIIGRNSANVANRCKRKKGSVIITTSQAIKLLIVIADLRIIQAKHIKSLLYNIYSY